MDQTNEQPDVCIIEMGGTVGDFENTCFVEVMSRLRRLAGTGNFLNIHVSHVPIVYGEQNTKPTQHTIQAARSAGLQPDLVSKASTN